MLEALWLRLFLEDVTLPISREGTSSKHTRTELQSTSDHRLEDQLKKMQLQGQKSHYNTLGPEVELPVTKNEVSSLGQNHGIVGNSGRFPGINLVQQKLQSYKHLIMKIMWPRLVNFRRKNP